MTSHLPCPSCKSSDGYSIQDDNWARCFSCGKNFSLKDEVATPKDRVATAFTPVSTVYRGFSERGLVKETITRYKVDVGGPQAPYQAKYPMYDLNGHHIGNKVRRPDKKFFFEGSPKNVGLFGRHAFPPGSAKAITVTEGQDDAMAAYQLLGSKYPCVSIHGASSAERDIKNDFEYLNSFETIVFCFDNDEAGKKAARAATNVGFPIGKLKVLTLRRHKDANEYLLSKETDAFVREWWQAPEYKPDGLRLGTEMWDEIINRKDSFATNYPFKGLNEKTFGIRLSEMVVVTADTGVGKALALDTPIPTPDGWLTMGELRVGDTIYDDKGNECKVTFATDVQNNRNCFEVVFKGGIKVVADEEHRWAVYDRSKRSKIGRGKDRPASILTTRQIFETLLTNRGERNYGIPFGKIIGEERELPCDPYLLGLWLGDGSSTSSSFYTNDLELLEAFKEKGYRIKDQPWDKYGYTIHKLSADVRKAGCFGNKHVPVDYLRASFDQRLELLRGLMDSDGYCARDGQGRRCEFTTTSFPLAETVYELCVSLGLAVSKQEGRATIYGKDCGPKWRIGFTTGLSVFKLKRKLERQGVDKENRYGTYRMISEVIPVESVPVRCIQVDSPSSLFLCGKEMIPTHNTSVIKHIEHLLLSDPIIKENNYGVGFLHLEEPNGDTALGLLSVHNSTPYHIPTVERPQAELRKAYDELLNNNRVVLWDHFGSNSVDAVLNKVRHMVALGCKYIVLDHLSIVVSDQSGDERKQLDEIATKLKTLTMELDIAVIAIIHTNRQGQIRGTAGVEQLANIVIRLERDKNEENEWRRNVTKVSVEKNRFCGYTGPACYLWYNRETARLIELEEEQVQTFVNGGHINDDQKPW